MYNVGYEARRHRLNAFFRCGGVRYEIPLPQQELTLTSAWPKGRGQMDSIEKAVLSGIVEKADFRGHFESNTHFA